MNIIKLYSNDFPELLIQLSATEEMQRLRDIGMNCGCQYTSFPIFKGMKPYSRYEHSLGVALILWHFTGDPIQTVAGFFHDISTPVFAHSVDFLNGDHLLQESTESGTADIILHSKGITDILNRHGISPDLVTDYHMYPIADNDSPQLCADRLEYMLGNMINYGFASIDDAEKIYSDIAPGKNENGLPELLFHSEDIAEAFGLLALKCSEIFVSDADRYSMQILAELLGKAIASGILSPDDLLLTESEVISKLVADEQFREDWIRFRCMSSTIQSDCASDASFRKIFAKKRYIDPLIEGKGRLSQISGTYSTALNNFTGSSQDYWVKGI